MECLALHRWRVRCQQTGRYPSDFVFSEVKDMSKGGVRWGAGRPGTKTIGERLQRVDIRVWARRGDLRQPGHFVWTWKRGEEHAGSVSVRVNPLEAVTLEYSVTTNGQRRDVVQRIALDRVGCHFGGWRQWFACPCCEKRVAMLYLRCGRFACRHCQRVAYASQSEDEMARMWRKQSRLETCLGDHWSRPKGMWRGTYLRLFEAIVDCEERREAAMADLAQRLFR